MTISSNIYKLGRLHLKQYILAQTCFVTVFGFADDFATQNLLLHHRCEQLDWDLVIAPQPTASFARTFEKLGRHLAVVKSSNPKQCSRQGPPCLRRSCVVVVMNPDGRLQRRQAFLKVMVLVLILTRQYLYLYACIGTAIRTGSLPTALSRSHVGSVKQMSSIILASHSHCQSTQDCPSHFEMAARGT